MKRLYFKEKAYKRSLVKDGYIVESIYCLCKKDDFIHTYLKISVEENAYIYVVLKNKSFLDGGYDEVLENVEFYFQEGKLDAVFSIGFIDRQIENKIIFDTLGESYIYEKRVEKFADIVYFKSQSKCLFDFCKRIENYDLSDLYDKFSY